MFCFAYCWIKVCFEQLLLSVSLANIFCCSFVCLLTLFFGEGLVLLLYFRKWFLSLFIKFHGYNILTPYSPSECGKFSPLFQGPLSISSTQSPFAPLITVFCRPVSGSFAFCYFITMFLCIPLMKEIILYFFFLLSKVHSIWYCSNSCT